MRCARPCAAGSTAIRTTWHHPDGLLADSVVDADCRVHGVPQPLRRRLQRLPDRARQPDDVDRHAQRPAGGSPRRSAHAAPGASSRWCDPAARPGRWCGGAPPVQHDDDAEQAIARRRRGRPPTGRCSVGREDNGPELRVQRSAVNARRTGPPRPRCRSRSPLRLRRERGDQVPGPADRREQTVPREIRAHPCSSIASPRLVTPTQSTSPATAAATTSRPIPGSDATALREAQVSNQQPGAAAEGAYARRVTPTRSAEPTASRRHCRRTPR